ncbi:zinc finger, CCHC-type containing protein [Tanacetum coccineum]
MTTSSANNSVFKGFFEKQKLTRTNFIDWYRQIRILLSIEDKLNYLEHPIPAALMPTQPEIQRNLENLGAYEMLQELKTSFAHYIDNLEHLGHPLSLGLGVSLILISLRKEFDSFVQNYNMYSMWKTINELHAMLKLHEQTFTLPKNKAPSLYMIRAGKYLAELLKKKKKTASGASGSGIFTIELNTFLNRSWIYDTGCGTYIFNITQGLRTSRKLKSGALSLYVGNGQREAIEAICVFHLSLPGGLVIVLNNCHYAPTITRGVISASHLYKDGFVNCFVNNTIQVSRNNMVYFSAILRDGIFKIDLSNSCINESSIYAVSNKRAMLNLDSALLWHCCLGHISKKRIEKLQHDGLLNSTNLRALKNVSLICLERWQENLTHIKWKGPKTYLD